MSRLPVDEVCRYCGNSVESQLMLIKTWMWWMCRDAEACNRRVRLMKGSGQQHPQFEIKRVG